jgi:hypothetical protein
MSKSYDDEILPSTLPGSEVRDFVHSLAAKHGVVYEITQLDRWADAITMLSDDDVVLNETELLLLELARRNLIRENDIVGLQVRYLRHLLSETRETGESDVEPLR